jgi:hypothetical protein
MISVWFDFNGDPGLGFIVSAEFAKVHGIKPGPLPLPKSGPAWVSLLGGECCKCFEEHYRGHFSKDGLWHAQEASS